MHGVQTIHGHGRALCLQLQASVRGFAARPALDSNVMTEESRCEELLGKQVVACEGMASILEWVDAFESRLQ